MAEAAVAEPISALTPAQLAAAHGLRVAGARPSAMSYMQHLWRYRHFIAAFASARAAATYKSTRLGQLWQVLTPIVNAAIYFLVFGVVLNTRHGVDNYIAHLCIGVFLFGFTQQVATSGIRALSDNLGLIRALQFPRASLAIAAMLTQFRQVIASVVAMLAIVLLTGETISVQWLVLLPVLVLLTLFNTGLAMILARVGTKMHDLKQLLPFIMRTWLYASGVFYGVSQLVSNLPAWASKVVLLNPMLIYIELARNALLGSEIVGSTPQQMWFLAVGWALLLSVGGYIYIWRGEHQYGRG